MAIKKKGFKVTLIDPKTRQHYEVKNDDPIYDGSHVVLEFISKGEDQIKWTKDSKPLTGEASHRIDFASVLYSDSGDYQATITNANGSVSTAPYTLTISSYPPIILQNPVNWSGGAGESAVFTAKAKAESFDSVQWQTSPDSGVSWVDCSSAWGGNTETLTIPTTLEMNDDLVKAVYINGGTSIDTTSAILEVFEVKNYAVDFDLGTQVNFTPASLPKGSVLSFEFILNSFASEKGARAFVDRQTSVVESPSCYMNIGNTSSGGFLKYDSKAWEDLTVNGVPIVTSGFSPVLGEKYTVTATSMADLALTVIGCGSSGWAEAFDGQITNVVVIDSLGNKTFEMPLIVASAGNPNTTEVPELVSGSNGVITPKSGEGADNWDIVNTDAVEGVSVITRTSPFGTTDYTEGDNIILDCFTVPADAVVTWDVDGAAITPTPDTPITGQYTIVADLAWNGKPINATIDTKETGDPKTVTRSTAVLTIAAKIAKNQEYKAQYKADYSGGADGDISPEKPKARRTKK